MKKKLYFVLVKMTTLKTSLQNLKSSEYEIILLINAPKSAMLTPEQRSVFSEIHPVGDFSVEPLKAIVASILAQRAEGTQIGFATNDESSMTMVGELRDHFKTGEPSFESVNRFKDKKVMKDALISVDPSIAVPQFVALDTKEYAQSPENYLAKVEEKLSYPIFAKPTDSAASCFTAVLKNRSELSRWLRENGSKENFELDEFLVGDLYHCDSLVKDGKILLTKASRYSAPCAEFMNGAALASMPLADSSAEAVEIFAFNQKVLKALSPVPNGAFHLEIFKQPNGKLVFLEIACRSPGAYVPQVFQKAFGINLEEAHLALQMGIETPEMYQPSKEESAAWIWYPKKAGVVNELHVPNITSAHELDWKIRPGDELKAASELGDLALGVKIWGKDYAQVCRELESLSQFVPYSMT